MRRSAFGRLHPAVAYAVGGGILGFAFLTRDPIAACLLALGALLFDGACRGASFALKRLALFFGAALLFGVTNPLISHRGVTVLFYLGNGAVTAESVVYGAVSGAMLADVILWCEALYRALPEDAALHYPALLLPKTTLVFSMAIRFVPRLVTRMREARAAQRAFHPDHSVKCALAALQTGVALTLEECCEIARGMEERGYGTGKVSSYSLYRFRGRDGLLVALTLLSFACVLTGYCLGAFHFSCYPGIRFETKGWEWYLFPLIPILLPALTEGKEKVLWRLSKSKA